MEKRLKVFQEIGLSEQKAKETAKNEKLASQLAQIIDQVTILNCNKSIFSVTCQVFSLAALLDLKSFVIVMMSDYQSDVWKKFNTLY